MIEWELCKKFKFDHTNNWYMYNPTYVLENDTQTPLGFWHTNRSPNLSQTTRPYYNQKRKEKKKRKEKRTCKIVDFAVPADNRVKLKESEKKDKYLDLARELKKLWNMKLTVISIVISGPGTVTKGLLKGPEGFDIIGRVETIQITAL